MSRTAMSREQFVAGWMLLTAQPWGKPYRTNSPEATIQVELYYRHVQYANPVVWQAVCEYHAQGEKWPSLHDLKTSLTNNGGYVHDEILSLPKYLRFEDAPIPLRACWTYQREHSCTLREAALAILPVWLSEHPHHEDYVDAARFLERAQANFGVTGTRGNVQVVR